MMFEEEAPEIKRKILKVARYKKPFDVADLIGSCRIGTHHSNDWREVAQELVEDGVLKYILTKDVAVCKHCGSILEEDKPCQEDKDQAGNNTS